MSNSSLVNYTKLSPNCNKPRNHKIDTITIHHMAGVMSVEQCGAVFAQSSRQASSNYGIDSNGRVGLYVDEANRSWCSSNAENDNRAITIEVSNDKIGGNWHVSNKALAKLIELCVDICKRNSIKRLNYTGDKTGNLTMHRWFAATACPGEYLASKFSYIAEQVNEKLNAITTPANVTGFQAVATNASAIKLTWNKANGADGYIVYRYDTKAKKYKRIAKGKNLTYTDKKLASGTSYKYAIRAYKTVDGKEVLSPSYPQITAVTTKPILDKNGYKSGDKTTGCLAFKELLLLAYNLKMTKYKVAKDGGFGNGTKKAVNELLGKWGYQQNGIAGENFIKRLHTEIEKKI